MPLIATRGAASAQGFGEFAQSAAPVYVEDVFSTYLYSGNNSSQTITNGIDLSTKGGMVWLKSRTNTEVHQLWDTVRGASKNINSNSTSQEFNQSPDGVNAFNTNGFSINSAGTSWNQSGQKYVSWTFREQAKFFDIVTWTGNGVNGRVINHNLTSTPGCVMIKRLDTTSNWIVSHRSAAFNLWLNSTNGLNSGNNQLDGFVNNSSFTSSSFTLSGGGSGINNVNASGGTYVAYVFAHNAGGFGLTGTDNVITCGTFTMDGSLAYTDINLGYEPQFVLTKLIGTDSGATGSWDIWDNMRGWPYWNSVSGPISAPYISPNSSVAESNNYIVGSTSTGLIYRNDSSSSYGQYIYIAIRRGPMKTPTSGTSVYNNTTYTGDGTTQRTISTTVLPDLLIMSRRGALGAGQDHDVIDRLRGTQRTLFTNLTYSDTFNTNYTSMLTGLNNNSFVTGTAAGGAYWNDPYFTSGYIVHTFSRAPGFFDEVCYDGTSSNIALTHNLGVAPEAIILKRRNGSGDWAYETNFTSTQHTYFTLNDTLAGSTTSYSGGYLAAQPTSTTVTVAGGAYSVSGSTYVMYLFASCPGVSKVGSYSGTGATQTISCGFAARFVMIKRTDSTGSWWVWDTARGMVAGTDPRLAYNNSNAEINANWVYTDASGFQIVTTDATVNASGGSYIYLAIA